MRPLEHCGANATGIAADVRDFAAVDAAFKQTVERFGPIDIVISGAAGNFVAPALSIPSNGFKTVVDIELVGTFHVFRACYDCLRRPGASLIAITAGQATHPHRGQAHVCAAKAGINMLVKCLALEWGADGVRVNGISPGPIDGTEGMARLTPTPEKTATLIAKIPLVELELRRFRGQFLRSGHHTSPSHKDPVRKPADDLFLHSIEAVVCPRMARIAAS